MIQRHAGTIGSDYFEEMFRSSDDPWRLDASDYEAAKRDATIAALGGRRYTSAWEVGCAKGALTERLAPYCARLLAMDVSETALEAARQRLQGRKDVAIERAAFPAWTPPDDFDLILLSEVVYYLDDGDLRRAGDRVAEALRPGGDVLLVHWTGETDYPNSADDAVTKLCAALGNRVTEVTQQRTDAYRLDLWRAA